MAAYQDRELEEEALELEPLFSRTGLSEHEWPVRLTVECQFWLSRSGQLDDPGKLSLIGPLTDPRVEIRIVIWDGQFASILWPAQKKQRYIDSRSVKGLIGSPVLSGIESDQITVMAATRFGGSGGQVYQIAGAFPLSPTAKLFRLTAWVQVTTTSVDVSAPNVGAAESRAKATLIRDAKITPAMIHRAFARLVRPGWFHVDLDHYSGKMFFDPKPARQFQTGQP